MLVLFFGIGPVDSQNLLVRGLLARGDFGPFLVGFERVLLLFQIQLRIGTVKPDHGITRLDKAPLGYQPGYFEAPAARAGRWNRYGFQTDDLAHGWRFQPERNPLELLGRDGFVVRGSQDPW